MYNIYKQATVKGYITSPVPFSSSIFPGVFIYYPYSY